MTHKGLDESKVGQCMEWMKSAYIVTIQVRGGHKCNFYFVRLLTKKYVTTVLPATKMKNSLSNENYCFGYQPFVESKSAPYHFVPR
jgi:hypothetical protein